MDGAGDVRGFYRALGVQLPEWAVVEASVSCFARPDLHRNQDRNRSCSVNVESGLWNCHGCGQAGRPYDAAIAVGQSPREAMDLLIEHGLAERRPRDERPRRSAAVQRPDPRPRAVRVARRPLELDERELAAWTERLEVVWPPRLLRSEQRALWRKPTLLELGCGWDRGRLTIPVRDVDGVVVGVLRYAPRHDLAAKMLAVPGTRLELIPHPAVLDSMWTVLVEGPPDMISARSQGLPAVAVPGDHAWEPAWAHLFTGRPVSVVMDCDEPGRDAAGRIASDLEHAGATPSIIDLAPERADGFDLTDFLAARVGVGVRELASALGWPGSQPQHQRPRAAGAGRRLSAAAQAGRVGVPAVRTAIARGPRGRGR